MVRAAVRTLTLNVYSIKDPAVQAFVVSKPASNYFNELAIFVAEQCQVRLSPMISPQERGLDPTCTHVMRYFLHHGQQIYQVRPITLTPQNSALNTSYSLH